MVDETKVVASGIGGMATGYLVYKSCEKLELKGGKDAGIFVGLLSSGFYYLLLT